MDKQMLFINKTKESKPLVSMSPIELDALSRVEVTYDEIEDNHILAYITSNRYRDIVCVIDNDYLTVAYKQLILSYKDVHLLSTGQQGKCLCDLLVELYPEKAPLIKHARLFKQDMLEVIK